MSKRLPVKLRAHVRQRAGRCCEYCLIHEDDVSLSHQPDHIVARKHRGQSQADNLAWACYVCNQLKGSDLSSIDLETGRIVRLFNFRKDRWSRHFQLDGAKILPLTAVGRATEHLLQLNEPKAVTARQDLIQYGRYPR
ncbi:MAG: HNH endonuclease [Gemmataceae bacterium]|nr:HNH endonuclease [Gemmataceae bacterium]